MNQQHFEMALDENKNNNRQTPLGFQNQAQRHQIDWYSIQLNLRLACHRMVVQEKILDWHVFYFFPALCLGCEKKWGEGEMG